MVVLRGKYSIFFIYTINSHQNPSVNLLPYLLVNYEKKSFPISKFHPFLTIASPKEDYSAFYSND